MLVDQAVRAAPVVPSSRERRAGSAVTACVLAMHGLRAFVRNPLALFFTLAMPAGFLLIVSAIFGNEVVEFRGGVRLAQYYTPAMAVFGAVEAAFCTLAVDLAVLRERRVFQRLRGTPVPSWAALAGRVAATVVVAGLAALLVVLVGVTVLDVEIVWPSAPAAVATLAVGIACFAALGLAAVAVVRGSGAAQALTNGILLPVAFISDVFTLTPHMPVWLERIGSVLPLKHFAHALGDAFDPDLAGAAFAPGHLAVLAGWGLAGAMFAAWRLRWDLAGRARHVPGEPAVARTREPRVLVRDRLHVLRAQTWYAFTGLRRDPASTFFSVVFPVLLLVLFPALMTSSPPERVEAVRLMLPGLAAYGIAIVGYATMPATVAEARERGVLKRLRGTPVPAWSYAAGRFVAVLLMSSITLVLLGVTAAVMGVRIPLNRVVDGVLVVLVSTACFAALGLALLTVVRRAQAAIAVSLGTLLPVAFFSGVFVVGADLPRTLEVAGNVLPLKHAAQALAWAVRPERSAYPWLDLAVLGAWLVVGAVAARRLSWES